MKKAASPKNDEAAKFCPLGTIQFCTGISQNHHTVIVPQKFKKLKSFLGKFKLKLQIHWARRIKRRHVNQHVAFSI